MQKILKEVYTLKETELDRKVQLILTERLKHEAIMSFNTQEKENTCNERFSDF